MYLGVPVQTRGFSIIEVLIAMAIGLMLISGVLIASFSNQMSTTNAQINMAATEFASESLNHEVEIGRKDFNLVNPTSTSWLGLTSDVSISQSNDFLSKLISIHVTSPVNPAINSIFSTLVTNRENVHSPDTCNSTPAGDWAHPNISSFALSSLIGTTSGTYAITQIDALNSRLYVSVDGTTYKTDPTLLIIDITNPVSPSVLGMIDTSSTTSGLAGIRAVTFNGSVYIFGASAGNFAKGQLQIFDVTDAAHPFHLKTYKIPIGYVPSAGNGNSIYYKDGYVYLGLTTAPGIVDFNVIDVFDPLNPSWKGGYSFGGTVEAISVKGAYAYLATDDNTREFAMLNIADAGSPLLGGVFNAPGSSGSGYGRSQFVLGELNFVGRTWVFNPSTPEFYVLNTSHPMNNPSSIVSRDIGTTSPATYGVYGVLVRDSLLYILTKAGTGGRLHILELNDLASLSTKPSLASLALPNGSGGVSLDCEGNTVYIGSNDTTGAGYISIVTAS